MAPSGLDGAIRLSDLAEYDGNVSADPDEEAREYDTLSSHAPLGRLRQALRDARERANAPDATMLGSRRASRRFAYRPRETRRFRRSKVRSLLKRALFIFPLSMLVYFGMIHVLEVLFGRAHLIWNTYRPAHANPHHRGTGWLTTGQPEYQAPEPLPCLSHNDYTRPQPLQDALRWGCTGVEADVWLFDQELYVGHMRGSLNQKRTLSSLYVKPIMELIDGQHSVVDGIRPEDRGLFASHPNQTLTLLVDLKTSGQATFEAVSRHVQPLRERQCLSYWDGQNFHAGAVTVVVSGHATSDMFTDRDLSHRDIFLDAPLQALWEEPRSPIESDDPVHAMDGEIDYGKAMSLTDSAKPYPDPDVDAAQSLFNTSTSYLASVSFTSAVGHVWRGHLSPRQMRIIRGQIKGAKRRGLKVRYWDTPSWPISLRNHVWHVLVKEGVDLLNVDDLEGAARQEWNVATHDLGLPFL